jgi:hypothetical protein
MSKSVYTWLTVISWTYVAMVTNLQTNCTQIFEQYRQLKLHPQLQAYVFGEINALK